MNSIPKLMSGIYLNGYGDFDQLELRKDIPVPFPRPNEVLIKVGAAGINNTDINTRVGWYAETVESKKKKSWSGSQFIFPRIQGADICGKIVAIGDKVDRTRLGERVLIEPCIRNFNGEELEQPTYFGSEHDGGFAEYTSVDSQHAYTINSDLSDAELASFPCSYSTAENMLTRSKVAKKEVVLITGASGGVGSAAIQLAKARGAYVIAITSPSKKEKIVTLGADKVITRPDPLLTALNENSVDVVIDLVCGKQFPDLIKCLKPFGRYVVSGAIAGPIVPLDVRMLYLKDLQFYGCTLLDQDVFSNLIKLIEKGRIQPLVAKTFPLEKMIDAQKMFLQKNFVGKIVLTHHEQLE